jgi:hypothetical protein
VFVTKVYHVPVFSFGVVVPLAPVEFRHIVIVLAVAVVAVSSSDVLLADVDVALSHVEAARRKEVEDQDGAAISS